MGITRLAIVRQWATVAIFVALAVAGFFAYRGLPINEFPNIAIPVVTITTAYPGANPEEIETAVTKPIEDAVAGLNNIDNIASASAQDFSAVTITFTDAADQNQIAADVQREVNTILNTLPTGVQSPLVLKADLSQAPIMELALVDDTVSPEALYSVAHDSLLPSLEQINGVSQVSLIGGQQAEIHIAADPIKLAAYGVSLAQLQAALAAANASLPGGQVAQGAEQFNLQVSGLFAQPVDLGSVVITGMPGQQVRVSDVATVSEGATEPTQVTRVNGKQAILIAIGKQAGSNLTDVTDAVTRGLLQLRAAAPASSQLLVVQDTTSFVRGSLNGIEEELILAIFLTSAILLMFLHNPRAAAIVLLSIPTTLLTTFIAMQIMGFSLNFLSTLGLTLTIGILVDDSIVVLENILRHLGRGERPFEAALLGRAEIGLAAVAITLVDVVVFAPTGLVQGEIGGFFREFGFTIAAATLTSLAVSFTLTPMLAARFLRLAPAAEKPGRFTRLGQWWDRGFGGLERRYRRVLGWSLRHRFVVCAVAAATVVAGVALVATGKVAVDFVPTSDSGYFSVNTEMPPGTSLAAHDAAMHQVEAVLLAMPEVETVTASVGVGAGGGVFGAGTEGQVRFGTVTVQVKPLSSGRRSVFAIVDDARERLAAVAGPKISVGVAGGAGGGGQAVGVRLTGPDLATLSSLATQLQNSLEQTPGLLNVTNGAPVGQPELLVQVDQVSAGDQGVNATALGLMVNSAFTGVVATKFHRSDGTLEDVRLQVTSDARSNIANVGDLPVQTVNGQTVPLSQVATLSQTLGPTEIDHYDRLRVVNIGADLGTGYSLGQVQPAVNRALASLALPSGYSAQTAGQSQQQAQSFGQLFLALGASVLLAYLLMAVLYNSLVHPLVILFALPAAVGGAMFGLFVFGYSFSVFSLIGLILLVALAIKNGILLVDRTNRNRELGMSVQEALLEAGPARLRPILMTSLTIAIALFPTALNIGEGAELRAPLAATVLGGVISSTLLTLVLIPVVYTMLDGPPQRLLRWLLTLVGLRHTNTFALASTAPAATMDRDERRADPVTSQPASRRGDEDEQAPR